MNFHVLPEEYYDIDNEKAVEIPLACRFMELFTDIVEVGAVTPYHFNISHTVIDPYDPYPKCIRKDAEQINYEKKIVLSISTIEHMGDEEFSTLLNQSVDRSKPIRFLIKLQHQASCFLVTFPTGYNRILDEYIRMNYKEYHVHSYRKKGNHWVYFPDLVNFPCYNYVKPYSGTDILVVIEKGLS